LEAVADAAVVEVLEAFLGDGGTGQIAAEALDLGVVGAVEGAGGVDVEALDDGDGLVGAGLAGIDEAQGGLAGAGAEEAEALGRGGAADGPAGGLVAVLVVSSPLEQPAHPCGGAPSDVGDLLGRWRRQRVEGQLAVAASQVDAVERQGMGVGVESERGVEALDEGHRPGVGEGDGAEAELVLGAPTVATLHLLDEGAHHRGAQRALLACLETWSPEARRYGEVLLRKKRYGGAELAYLCDLQKTYAVEDILAAIDHGHRYGAYGARELERILELRAEPRSLEDLLAEGARRHIREAMRGAPVKQRSLADYGHLLGLQNQEATDEENDP